MSIKTYHLFVVSPEKKIFDDFVKKIIIKGSEGELGIYPQHISMLTLIKPCFLSITKKVDKEIIYISSGILEIQKNNVMILAEIAIHAKDFKNNLNIAKLSIFKCKAEEYILSLNNNINKVKELSKFKKAIKKFQIIEKIN
ncbi:ATP synthase F1 subunit epsilon [Arsenophonus symbiont of Ornithomya chloropus]|uniref:ATP synthase F1 subunit epsilon n=1 Tax=Arsenophonus symbiont of Ornithomya chloropus TaxID=634121 RepID=UPI0032B218DB